MSDVASRRIYFFLCVSFRGRVRWTRSAPLSASQGIEDKHGNDPELILVVSSLGYEIEDGRYVCSLGLLT